MKLRRLATLLVLLLLGARALAAQSDASAPSGIIERIEFRGLHRVSSAALRAQISSREGEPLDAARLERDVRALDRLGWFDSIAVETRPTAPLADDGEPTAASRGLCLVFDLPERRFLARADFRGSRALSQERIAALLAARGIKLRTAAPANPSELRRAARAIEAELAELGHPRAAVSLHLEELPGWAVRARFEIDDGPHILVRRVAFTGNRAFSDRMLRRRMQRVAPGAWFAGLRRKNVYAPERLATDLERIQDFYRNHGYAEARVGAPRVERVGPSSYQIKIPVEEGQFYRLEALDVQGATPRARAALEPALRRLAPPAAYSQEKLERAREALARVEARQAGPERHGRPAVELRPEFDRAAGRVRVTLRVLPSEGYIVRRIEIVGHHRFPDRYYLRRIGLKEGEPFDPDKIEQGLERLARGGFVKPPTRRDVHVNFDATARTADIAIRFEEIGRQRISLTGGASGQASTIGIVYNVFNLFGGEELLTAHLEGGPESVNVLLGVAKDGLFGTRASLGMSVFRNVVRPRVQTAAGRQRLFTSSSAGGGLATDYPLTPRDTLGAKFELSETATQINLSAPAQPVPGFTVGETRAREAMHVVKLSWSHNDGAARFDVAQSVSGGWLGGDEKLLGSSLEYSRALADPFTDARNSWALHGRIEGVSAYAGGLLPLQERLFAGPQLLRGFRTGELGPYAAVQAAGRDPKPAFQARPAGADLTAAFNGEYRVPLEPRLQAAGFFDTGSGWLLPNWLGRSRPAVLSGSNGVLRASTGIELRFQLPVVNQPLRFDYAANPLRLARALLLPDGSAFRPPDRRAAFVWALGSLF